MTSKEHHERLAAKRAEENEQHLAGVALHTSAVCAALPARRDPVRMMLASLLDNLGGDPAYSMSENRTAQHLYDEVCALVEEREQRPVDYIGLAIEAPEGASVTLVRLLVERIVLAVKEAADLVPHTRDDAWNATLPLAVREAILKIVARNEELRAVHEDLGKAEEGRALNAALLKARDAERDERKARGAEVAEAMRCMLEQVEATLKLTGARDGETLVDAVKRALSARSRAAASPPGEPQTADVDALSETLTPSEVEDLKRWVKHLRQVAAFSWPPKEDHRL